MSPIVKPGYKTTEFWTVLIGYGLAFFVASGLIDVDKANKLNDVLPDLLTALIPLIAALVNVYYIMARKNVKIEALKSTPVQPVTPSVPSTDI